MHSLLMCGLPMCVGVVWLLSSVRSGCAAAAQSDVVKPTSNGFVMGKEIILPDSNRVLAFLGIPYAEPPLGPLRFKPPVDKKKWKDIWNATQFGPICFQPEAIKVWDVDENGSGQKKLEIKMLLAYSMSEDCLSLNVYTPKAHIDLGSLPVLVYIHGGSYYMNSGRFFPAEKLASNGVIVVTCNYRLGPLGFLSTEDGVSTGNYGLLDQLHVLKWIQKNIAYFGGDPNKVTLFGNSAGGASVTFHLLTPLAKGLFSAVIAQSGCAFAPWALQLRPRLHAIKLAQEIGCPTSPTEHLVECIRTFSPTIITQKSTMADGLLVSYAPVVDGWFGGHYLPDHPENMVNTGRFQKVPFMTGITRDEVSIWFQIGNGTFRTLQLIKVYMFVRVCCIPFLDGPEMDMLTMKAIVYKYAKELLQRKKVSDLNHVALSHAIMSQYFYKKGFINLTGKGHTKSLIDFISDVGLKAPCVQLLDRMNIHSSAPKYMYEFAYYSADDVKSGRQEWIGSYHESELQYIFGEPYLNYSNTLKLESDKKVSDFMMKLWINFANFGNPTESFHNPLNATWQPYTNHHHAYLAITETPKMKENYLVENILFWNSFFPIFSDYSIESNLYSTDCPSSRRKWLVWFLTSLYLGVILILSSELFCCSATAQSDVVKLISNGYVLGKEIILPDSNQVLAFLGIPYAEPPIGALRFQPPVDKKDWNDVLNATQFGPICYQHEYIRIALPDENESGQKTLEIKFLQSFTMSEDCLSLNVYIPKAAAALGSLPVLAYIHGGSYGINSGRFYDGEILASKGVIVVTSNYRLGSLGFLSTEDNAATGNYGLLDQLHVFKWIQKNIANFGGDPNKVTIFGNSAGGSSVTFHLLSPLAKGLFSSVIAQSGSPLGSWALQSRPLFWATTLAEDVGCENSQTQNLVECLRSLPANLVIEQSTISNGLLVPYAPVVDGWFGGDYLPDHPEIMINMGQFQKVPFMTGLTSNEAAIWYQRGGQVPEMRFLEAIVKHNVNLLLINSSVSDLNYAALTHAIMAQYFFKKGSTDLDGPGNTNALIEFVSDVVFKAPCMKLLQSMSNHTTEPIYMYEFAYFSLDDVKTRGQWIGAYHESELQYLFGMPHFNYTNTLRLETDKTVSDFMMELWINFAKYGNPTTPFHNPLDVIWQPYTAKRHLYLEITESPTMKENYLVENSFFWNSFFPIFRDYPIESEPGSTKTESSDSSSNWLIWFLTTLVCLLCLLCASLLFYLIRRRPLPAIVTRNADRKSITAV
uniref:Carboxylesterase type B domain-containing protein n=1 Tax=Strigamia maritima TaxID=126957 RepID=T1IS79_STRMM